MRILRFSLRTLFMGITLACMSLAWASYHLRWIHSRHEFLEAGRGNGGLLCFDDRPAPWQFRVFGEQGFMHQSMFVQQSDLKAAKNLFPEVENFTVVTPDHPLGL